MSASLPASLPASMLAIRAALPDYFARDLASDFAALSDKDTARANLARSITGCAIQWAHSGNDAHVKFAASLPAKGVNAARCRVALALITCKPRAMKAATLAEFENYANELCMSVHMTLTPAPATHKAPTIKAPALEAVLAAIQAGLYRPEDIAALQAALATAPTIEAPAPAPAPAPAIV